MLESRITGIAYETIVEKDGSLPLLTPMSEVAGRMAVQIGAQYLEAQNGGRGVLLSGIPGVAPANVVILGGGVVGTNSAKIAVGMGAHVTVIDRNLQRLRELDDVFNGLVVTLASNAWTIGEALKHADLVIGAVLIPGSVSAQACAAFHDRPDETRRGDGGCGDRSGRLFRNVSCHHPHRPDLFCRWCAALLRRQHAGRGAPHLDLRLDERHVSLRAGTG